MPNPIAARGWVIEPRGVLEGVGVLCSAYNDMAQDPDIDDRSPLPMRSPLLMRSPLKTRSPLLHRWRQGATSQWESLCLPGTVVFKKMELQPTTMDMTPSGLTL